MDILTQGIAGATLAQAGATSKHRRAATLIGLLAALLPDADIFIHLADDPLLNLELHRQFSHSLVFIPVGALIAAILLHPLFRKQLPFKSTCIYSLLGYSTGGILDACTSFGTQLLWPFSSERIAWNLIAVVDPVFTLGIGILLLIGWRTRKPAFPVLAIGFAGTYLLLAYHQQQSAFHIQQTLISARGHQASMAIVKPTLGNILLWRSVYRHNDHYYVDGVRVALSGKTRVYAGDMIAAYAGDRHADRPALSRQANDIMRFSRLSQGYLVRHPLDNNVIGDIRYAMLPDSIQPLWGIRLAPENPNAGVTTATFRTFDTATRQHFINMLLGY